MSKTKKILKAVGILLLFAVILLIIGIVWLTIREYRPKAVETLTPPSGVRTISNEDTFRVMTFNTGYAGLDKTEQSGTGRGQLKGHWGNSLCQSCRCLFSAGSRHRFQTLLSSE